MSNDFRRIQKSGVTEAIMEAMEKADTIESIVILYECKDQESPIEGVSASPHGLITNEECTIEKANFLVDGFKAWIFNCIFGHFETEEEGDDHAKG